MKIIKKVLIGLGIIIAVLLIAGLFIKKDMSAEREVVINKPKAEVFNYIKLLKNQNNYGTWSSLDPNMKQEFRGTDGTVGFVSAWDSENGDAGKGEQEIKKIAEGERIDYELRFIKPFESTAQTYFTTESVSANQTKVKWGFKGNMSYPFNIMRIFMSPEEAIGKDFQSGLNKLKNILEKQ